MILNKDGSTELITLFQNAEQLAFSELFRMLQVNQEFADPVPASKLIAGHWSLAVMFQIPGFEQVQLS